MLNITTDLSSFEQENQHQNGTSCLTRGGLTITVEVDLSSDPWISEATTVEAAKRRVQELLGDVDTRIDVYISP